jgi:hypothetical protein
MLNILGHADIIHLVQGWDAAMYVDWQEQCRMGRAIDCTDVMAWR